MLANRRKLGEAQPPRLEASGNNALFPGTAHLLNVVVTSRNGSGVEVCACELTLSSEEMFTLGFLEFVLQWFNNMKREFYFYDFSA